MINRGILRLLWVLFPLLLSPTILAAVGGGKGQGAVVVRDDAPVYSRPEGPEVEWKLKRGDAMAGMTGGTGFGGDRWLFDEKKGRVHVLYFQGEQKGASRSGWMDPADLSRFTYDGSCQNGSPLAVKGFSQRWNACFEEARDNKLDPLRALWAQEDAAKAGKTAPAAQAQEPTRPPEEKKPE